MTRRPIPAWTPFKLAGLPEVTEDQITGVMKTFHELTREDVERQLADLRNDTVFLNSRYQVNMRKRRARDGWPDMIHLSIKRIDKDRVGVERYRDFMRIKDQLIGPEFEALEIYPAREREVDTANQYHLWVFSDPTTRLPFGFNSGRVVTGESTGGARQHPFDDGNSE